MSQNQSVGYQWRHGEVPHGICGSVSQSRPAPGQGDESWHSAVRATAAAGACTQTAGAFGSGRRSFAHGPGHHGGSSSKGSSSSSSNWQRWGSVAGSQGCQLGEGLLNLRALSGPAQLACGAAEQSLGLHTGGRTAVHRPAPPGGSSKRWAMQQAVLTTVLPAAQCFSAAVGAARCRRDLPWTPLARASRRRHLKRRYLESTRLAVPPGGVYHPTACGRFTGGRSRTPLAIPQSSTPHRQAA